MVCELFLLMKGSAKIRKGSVTFSAKELEKVGSMIDG